MPKDRIQLIVTLDVDPNVDEQEFIDRTARKLKENNDLQSQLWDVELIEG